MTSTRAQQGRAAWVAALLTASLFLTSCQPLGLIDAPVWVSGPPNGYGNQQNRQPTVRMLAEELDSLERHIERYGSVVAKQPDVWGQARLTKYRDEFEQQMAAELPNFTFALQGSSSVSDQAYVADAMALSAAVSSSAATLRRGAASSSSSSTTTTTAPSSGSQPTTIQPPPLPDMSNTFQAFSSMSRTPVNMPAPLGFAGAKNGIALEPTILLDEKAQYINHLHELRRISDGDDTADSPGYALNLVRFPVSVLPGKRTDIGYGAEVTLTMTPYLNNELLPTTFRNLVINDLIDQISFPATQFINNPDNSDYFVETNADDINHLFNYMEKYTFEDMLAPEHLQTLKDLKAKLPSLFKRPEWGWVDKLLAYTASNNGACAAVPCEPSTGGLTPTPPLPSASAGGTAAKSTPAMTAKVVSEATAIRTGIRALSYSLRGPSLVPASKSRNARSPFPPSEMLDVFGYDFMYHLAADAYRALSRERFSWPSTEANQVYIHLPDVQSYFQGELAAAQKLLANPANIHLWEFCSPRLVSAIRNRDADSIKKMRDSFKAAIAAQAENSTDPDCAFRHSTPVALVWATLVDSALLCDQLVQDMKESAGLKGCPVCDTAHQDFYLPDPSPEARQAFNNYVRCRWPIHVFALDPAAQEQNLASSFSSRREMQLALSLAFVSGRVNASNMMRFARRLEFDFATIDLNGTSIGFSHGDETFGWRFYPRFQVPDIESNARVFFRDLLCGGPNKDALLRQRRLEPGIRECYAVVIMPSFVPYASLNISTNWFSLVNPQRKELDSQYAIELSNHVKSIETCAPTVVDGQCYRDGELERLIEKARQLATRLPLQSTQVQIPYENTLGGFAMFNTGVTDLAPELIGWYGTSSINPNAATTVFLVGNHFSVHQTTVIAGGQQVTNVQLLSRQVLQATIPQNPLLVGDASQKFVDVQLATPYGVTQHLLIPAVVPPKTPDVPATTGPATQSIAWSPSTLSIAFAYASMGIGPPPGGTSTTSAPTSKPLNLLIQQGDVDGSKYNVVDVTLSFDKKYAINPSNTLAITNVAFDSKQGGYPIAADALASQILPAFSRAFGPEQTNPVVTLSVPTQLTFRSSTKTYPDLTNKSTSNNLTVQWVKATQASTTPASPTGPGSSGAPAANPPNPVPPTTSASTPASMPSASSAKGASEPATSEPASTGPSSSEPASSNSASTSSPQTAPVLTPPPPSTKTKSPAAKTANAATTGSDGGHSHIGSWLPLKEE